MYNFFTNWQYPQRKFAFKNTGCNLVHDFKHGKMLIRFFRYLVEKIKFFYTISIVYYIFIILGQ